MANHFGQCLVFTNGQELLGTCNNFAGYLSVYQYDHYNFIGGVPLLDISIIGVPIPHSVPDIYPSRYCPPFSISTGPTTRFIVTFDVSYVLHPMK